MHTNPETGEKTQLHVSMLSTAERCGQQFIYAYGFLFGLWNQKEVEPPGVALLVGDAVHQTAYRNLSHKIKNGYLLSIQEVKEIAADTMKGLWNSQELNLQPEQTSNLKKVKGEAVDDAVSLAALHHLELADKIQPIAAEKKWVLELPGYPFDLAGTVDTLTVVPGREAKTDQVVIYAFVRDLKTKKQTPPEWSPMVSVQMQVYKMAMKKIVPVERIDLVVSDYVYMDFLVKTKEPKLVTLGAMLTPIQESRFWARVDRLVENIEKGSFMPAAPDSIWCDRWYCGFWKMCKFWSGR